MSSQSSLVISPAIKELELKPGTQADVVFNIQNNLSRQVNIKLDYGYLSSQGTFPVEYLLRQGTPGEYFAIGWLSGPETVALPAGVSSQILVTVSVPQDIESSSYFPAVIFSELAETETQVGIAAELIGLMQITVEGKDKIEKSMQITELTASQGSLFDPSRNISYGALNDSSFHVIPRGSITVYSPSGVRIATDIRFNDSFRTFLPGQGRSETAFWEYTGQGIGVEMGNYTLAFEVVDANTNQVLDTKELTYFVLPVQYIVGGLIAVSLLVGLVGFLWYRLRRGPVVPQEELYKQKLRTTHK